MDISIVIRTLNEAKHLGELLDSIKHQETQNLDVEVILVDSGSTDKTLDIAQKHGCNIIHITREKFSFGKSLNLGIEGAKGEIIVMISGHCVPTAVTWLQALCQPLIKDEVEYAYGKQQGGAESHYSECCIFSKYYPEQSQIPQNGFYCNNANSAIKRSAWEKYKFDEELTGLEDMALAKLLVSVGKKVGYVAQASVFHYHNETWSGIRTRFERESIALQSIMPQVHIRKRDLMRYIVSSIYFDWRKAWREKVFCRNVVNIVLYRFYQYWGSYIGNHDHRQLSHKLKEEYFYPN